ncbi:unnamed protein product [Cylicocyclus nassatus]|uniref:WAP domain-containing protein n=1 Tax=Cylicocyclus nassatus TaxID=53992 RepID=A0AA36H4J2_CYLNA|nr:unnamed protein product [Cylicocyclus nassatus]
MYWCEQLILKYWERKRAVLITDNRVLRTCESLLTFAGISSMGTCCPDPSRAVHEDGPDICKFDCRADDDCSSSQKYCYDGCEASPLSIVGEAEEKKPEVKPGVCPYLNHRQCSGQPLVHRCSPDVDCVGVQKCCADGCTRKGLYPEKALWARMQVMNEISGLIMHKTFSAAYNLPAIM